MIKCNQSLNSLSIKKGRHCDRSILHKKQQKEKRLRQLNLKLLARFPAKMLCLIFAVPFVVLLPSADMSVYLARLANFHVCFLKRSLIS